MIFGSTIQKAFSTETIYVTAEEVERLIETTILTEAKGSSQNYFINSYLLDQRRKKIMSKGCADIVNCLKGNKSDDRKQQTLSQIVMGIYQDLGDAFYIVKPTDKKFAGFPAENVQKAVILLSWVCMASVVAQLCLNILFGMAGQYISAIVCAPLIEESAKQISIRGGFKTEFFMVFNTLEFTEYVISYTPFFGLIKTVVARLAAVGLHTVTTIVQFTYTNKEFQKKVMKDPKDPKEKAELEAMGLGAGMIIHALWNAMCMIL